MNWFDILCATMSVIFSLAIILGIILIIVTLIETIRGR